MCGQREGSLRGLEGRGTAGDLGFKLSLVVEIEHVSFLTGSSILHCVRFSVVCYYFVSRWDYCISRVYACIGTLVVFDQVIKWRLYFLRHLYILYLIIREHRSSLNYCLFRYVLVMTCDFENR